MGGRVSCFGKSISTDKNKKNKKTTDKKIWWQGKYSTFGQPHGPGIEHDEINGITAYGQYDYGSRVGSWQFSKDGMVRDIHEYDSDGTLQKITEIRDGVHRLVYSRAELNTMVVPTNPNTGRPPNPAADTNVVVVTNV